MSIDVQAFVLEKDPYPNWFRDLERDDRLTYMFREDGSILQILIKNSKKFVTAKPEDTLIKIQDDILVVPPDAAKKYMGGDKDDQE